MLRIIAGKYRGRKITTGKHLAARPTMSIVREAIFSILSSRKPIYNLNVLDLFCGSGSFHLKRFLAALNMHSWWIQIITICNCLKKQQKILELRTMLR